MSGAQKYDGGPADPRAAQLRIGIRKCLAAASPRSWTVTEHRIILEALEAIQHGRDEARKASHGGAAVIHLPSRHYEVAQ